MNPSPFRFSTGPDSAVLPRAGDRVTPPVHVGGSASIPSRRRRIGEPLCDAIALVCVLAGAGFVIWAYRLAPTRHISSYVPLFWIGMALAYLAIGWRAVTGSRPALWLALLGGFTLLPKFWMSPSGPIYFDETSHYALLREVIASGRLFQWTPLLPIGRDYPGMESAAAAIHWLTSLPTWDSALVLVATVHVLLPVQVYFVARALPVRVRWAAAAGLVYAANPSFVYEDVQFAYETVGVLMLMTILRLYFENLGAESVGPTRARRASGLLLIALFCFGCVVVHHLTSVTGIALLLVGALFVRHRDSPRGLGPLITRWLPVLSLLSSFVLWVAFVAPLTVPYLFPNVSRPFAHVFSLIGVGHKQKQSATRGLFSHSMAPIYERVAAVAAPSIIALVLLGVVVQWVRRRPRTVNHLWPIAISAAYLVSLPLTLLAEGAAGVHRTWASTFVAVAMLPALVAVLFSARQRSRRVRGLAWAAAAVALVVMLMGDISAGTPVDYRFPGPYEFGSDTLSVTPETIALAHWVRGHLGPGAHVVTDRFTGLALTGRADAVTPLPVPSLPIAAIWYDHRPPPPSLMLALQRRSDDYLAVDLRDADNTPFEAPLFASGEPDRVPYQTFTSMAKWPWLQLLYHSAHYRLYRIDFERYDAWYPFHANDVDGADDR